MSGKIISFLVLLLFLTLCFSTVTAQEISKDVKVVRIAQEDLPPEAMVDEWLLGGEFQLADGLACFRPQYEPGPAPEPYPVIQVWEPGIEQLGASSVECDGLWFLNGKFWYPRRWIFIIYRIRIPRANMRTAEEFEQDLNLALWVDWNLSEDWEKNEKVLGRSVNIQEYFPTDCAELELWYLTCFRVPRASSFTSHCGGIEFFKEKLWTRALVSFHDEDASPNGQSVFGESEDYQVTYFEVIRKKRKRD